MGIRDLEKGVGQDTLYFLVPVEEENPHSHFTDEEAVTWRGKTNCPQSHPWQGLSMGYAELGLSLKFATLAFHMGLGNPGLFLHEWLQGTTEMRKVETFCKLGRKELENKRV